MAKLGDQKVALILGPLAIRNVNEGGHRAERLAVGTAERPRIAKEVTRRTVGKADLFLEVADLLAVCGALHGQLRRRHDAAFAVKLEAGGTFAGRRRQRWVATDRQSEKLGRHAVAGDCAAIGI